MSNKKPPELLQSDLQKLRPAFTKEFINDTINSVDFSENGTMALCAMRNIIKFFRIDCNPVGETTLSEKDGIGMAKFFTGSKVLYTTMRNQVKLVDSNNSLPPVTFSGHHDKITTLSVVNPTKFMTASLDNHVKIWDMRVTALPLTDLTRNSHPYVASNPLSSEVAIAEKVGKCYMIEIFNYIQNKEGKRFIIDTGEDIEVTSMEYSADGTQIMLNTRNSVIIIIDAATGDILHEFRGIQNLYNDKIDACFTPCSKFVLAGSQNGQINCWKLEDSEKVIIFENVEEKNSPCLRIAFNKNAVCFCCASDKKFHIWIEK